MFAKDLLLHVLSCAQIERRMELVRVVSHNTHKRMVSCLQGHIGADAEKRHVRHWACCSKTCHCFSLPLTNQFNQLFQDVFDITSHTNFELSLFALKVSTVGLQSMISLLCFLPHITKKCTTVRTTPLYRKWSGKNTDYLLHLSGSRHHLLHFPFTNLSSLFAMHDTLAFGILW